MLRVHGRYKRGFRELWQVRFPVREGHQEPPNPVPPAGPTLACTQFKLRLKPAPNPNMLSAEVKQFTFLPNADDKSACLSFFLGFSIYVVIDYFAPNSSDFNLD